MKALTAQEQRNGRLAARCLAGLATLDEHRAAVMAGIASGEGLTSKRGAPMQRKFARQFPTNEAYWNAIGTPAEWLARNEKIGII